LSDHFPGERVPFEVALPPAGKLARGFVGSREEFGLAAAARRKGGKSFRPRVLRAVRERLAALLEII